ncbi:MAG: glycosyltransferase family 4 protein [Firmicutes bacterium]|nr:glycosyltransferase family 4 protein [Candidatus Fiminaster equi]
MKILLVSQYYYPERFSVTDFAESLVKQGHEVTVLTGKPNYGFKQILPEYKKVKYEEINGVKVHRVKLVPRKDSKMSIIRNYLSFHKYGKRFVKHFREEFDVVLACSLSPVISVSPALHFAKKHNIPCVLYCQDLWPEAPVVAGMIKRNSLSYRIIRKWSKSIYSRCDRIVISSPSFKDYFVKELHIEDKGFNVVNQPIISSSKEEEPIKYQNMTNIVYAGNIGSMQMVDSLVKAMRYVRSYDIKLHLLGSGSLLKQIQKQIIVDGLNDKVEYHGNLPIEQAEAHFKNADALIVSLKNSGYVGKTIPNKAIQYLKYGKPIIGVVQGDSKTLLENAKGAIFTGENPQEIGESINKIISMDQKEKDQLGLNNKQYFEENLTTEKLTQLLVAELNEVKK